MAEDMGSDSAMVVEEPSDTLNQVSDSNQATEPDAPDTAGDALSSPTVDDLEGGEGEEEEEEDGGDEDEGNGNGAGEYDPGAAMVPLEDIGSDGEEDDKTDSKAAAATLPVHPPDRKSVV